MAEHARCDYCARLRPLTGQGVLALHYVQIPVSAKALHSVGSRQVRRRCPGSWRRPRQRPDGAA